MVKYTRKPTTIEAVHWNGENLTDVFTLAGSHATLDKHGHLIINTPNGHVEAKLTDFIIKGTAENDFYPCSEKVFRDTYDPASEEKERGIGWAIQKMREGNFVRRHGWNGKGMYIWLDYGEQREDRLDTAPYIAMHTAQGVTQPGWLCSQADLLATDWEIAA